MLCGALSGLFGSASALARPALEKPNVIIFFHSRNQPAAIRQGPWKLHIRFGSQLGKNYGFQASREKPLLFQVEQDLEGSFDLAKEHPGRVRQMLKELEAYESQVKEEGSFWDKQSSREGKAMQPEALPKQGSHAIVPIPQTIEAGIGRLGLGGRVVATAPELRLWLKCWARRTGS